MSEKLNLQDLIDLLAEKQKLTKKDAELFLRELFSLILSTIEQKDSVKIKDFGTFKLVKVNSRKSVDVNTGEDIEIPAHYKLAFTPDKTLRDLINTPFAHFESVVIEEGVSFENITFEPGKDENEEDTESPSETAANNIDSMEEINENKEKEPENAVQENNETNQPDETDTPPVKEEAEQEEEEEYDLGSNSTTRNLIIVAVIAVILICGYLFKDDIFSGQKKTDTIEEGIADKQALPADTLAVSADSTNIDLPDSDIDSNEGKTESVAPKKDYKPKATITLKSGDTLRKLALTHYGDKTFWVYIYQENIDKIKNFNNIPIGTRLIIPAPEKYGINVKDSQSLTKAKELEDKYFNK